MQNTLRSFQEIEELGSNLGSIFSDRSSEHDLKGDFVADNYLDLKEARFFSLAIPSELGGGGLSYAELCAVIRQMGQHCGSTALAFAMHSHPVALNVFKFIRGDERAEATLTKIAGDELIIAGTGANDWLESNGTAEAIDGGYIVNAHKRFVSGGPGAQVLVSSVNHKTDQGEEVLHFSIPFSTEGVGLQNNWNTLGMRATGSNDVVMENVFIPAAAIVARRPAGQWHGIWDVVLPIAMPLIASAYLGLADAARELAIEAAKKTSSLYSLLGDLNNHYVAASLAVNDIVDHCSNYQFQPGIENSLNVLTRKTLANKAIRELVEISVCMVGGSGFFKGHPLERIVRDVRAMHFHPLPEHLQKEWTGKLLAGESAWGSSL